MTEKLLERTRFIAAVRAAIGMNQPLTIEFFGHQVPVKGSALREAAVGELERCAMAWAVVTQMKTHFSGRTFHGPSLVIPLVQDLVVDCLLFDDLPNECSLSLRAEQVICCKINLKREQFTLLLQDEAVRGQPQVSFALYQTKAEAQALAAERMRA
ncbi:MAG: hypothetical protein WC641_07620 [Patescibacteria group bacterium]